jgi:two-component system, cell cycle response regulator
MRRVMVVDDDRENVDLLTEYLVKEGHTVQSAVDGEAALHRLRAWKPHLILLDVNMPKMSGIELIPKIRNLTQDEYASIILISANMTVEDVTKGLEAGADDYLTKPFRAQDLISRIRAMLRLKEVQDALKRANHRIEELNSTDDLTNLMNMRSVYRRGEEEIVRAKRFRKPVSSLLLNLDGFSSVNQSYGFVVGSHVLKEVAMRIKQSLRAIDLVARVGADEFFILLCETDLAGAEFVAERVRDSIQSSPFKNDKQSIRLTATIGVAGLTPDQTNQRMSDLLHITTEALRSAKANGSNRIEVYSFT